MLTVPQLGSEFDREVGNRITEHLNREYGDKKLSGCIHPHRAPGFENRKPKHRREDGGYPQVKLLFAECREAARRRSWAERLNGNMQRPPLSESSSARRSNHRFTARRSTSAYYTHLENIRNHLSIEDYSRVDAMIALRLRSNGHSREAVAETIRACAPTIRETQKGRNWQRYAERTADYAFGPAGDRDLERNARYRELWRGIEDCTILGSCIKMR